MLSGIGSIANVKSIPARAGDKIHITGLADIKLELESSSRLALVKNLLFIRSELQGHIGATQKAVGEGPKECRVWLLIKQINLTVFTDLNSSDKMEEDKKNRKLISSSMVDLKAELFRKQEEFKKQKEKNALFTRPTKSVKDTKSIWSKQNSGVLARAQKDLATKEKDDEEEEMLVKSRRILEQKTKVYDSITSSSTIPEEDGSEYFLVDFQKKAIDVIVEEREKGRKLEEQKKEEEAERKSLSAEISAASCPEDEWVDFVDSLGRDRRCMKKDLSTLMKKDQELAKAQAKKKEASMKRFDSHEPISSSSSKGGLANKMSDVLPHLMSQDMHREMMRQKWENEARELLDKGQDEVHYSNVQFDEIRAHGVGYYQFSKDHSKRQEELEELQKLRDETKNQQSTKEKIKDKRKAMLEARLAKVRQRRKLKEEVVEAGKIAEEKDVKEYDSSKLKDDVSILKTEGDTKKEAEEKRKNHVREWDKDKAECNTWGLKDYVTWRRKERENEFAPPSLYFEENVKTHKPSGSNSVLSDTDRLKRLQESVSAPSSNQQKSAISSTSLFVDRTAKISSFDSIPLPKGPASTHTKDHIGRSEMHLTSANHHHSVPQPSANIAGQQQQQHYQGDSVGPQFFSGGHGNTSNSSWQGWTNTQGMAQAHQYCQSTQGPPLPHNWYHMYQNNQIYTEYPSGQNSQGSQGWGPHQSTTTAGNTNSSASQYYSDPNSSSQYTSDNSLKRTTTMTSSDLSRSDPATSSTQNQPCTNFPALKKSKVPKLSVVDMRYMNNFDTSSINPEPGRVPDVAGVPYKPGTFSKYRPQGVDGSSNNKSDVGQGEKEAVAQEGAQISGGPLIYTKQQLERQQKELDEQEDKNPEDNADSEDDRKLQEFLSSIRASSQ
ncbi:coiled-coil domain-containing protein 174 [Elysia marginata]|uniref:Coiled-coil domain-containing protein 174 n=1 Tax=Elysia marginata TaxID=1093978 RepID=A0AAV4IQ23_9GAST|nr:coiled-coil domain-containing protein 174 [Elysia marginata]